MRDYCPKCQSQQNLVETQSKTKETDNEGNTIELVTKTFHCQICHNFIKSEDSKNKIKSG